MRAYRVLQWLLRLASYVFFRRIEVVGRDNIPKDAAVLFCGNHPNSLLDPILITAHCQRIVHFAAKDVLFESRILRFFLRVMGAVPVRRRRDHPDGPLDNSSAFDALHDVLGQGSAIGIFPEGISHNHSQLSPLKTGAARIAMGTARKNPNQRIVMIPTGLIYFNRDRFRSSVLIQFGEPIDVTTAQTVSPEHREDADRVLVKQLTEQLDLQLRGLTVNAASWETISVLDAVRRLYQPSHISLHQRVELQRRFNKVYPTVADQPEVQELYDEVRAYQTRLAETGLSDDVVRKGVSARETALRIVSHIILVVWSAPLFVIGAPIHLPLGLLFKAAGSWFSPRKDVVGTTKFVVGFLTTLLVYVVIAGLFAWKFGIFWGLLVAIILPLSGRAVLHVLGRVQALRRLFLTSSRILRLRREVHELRKLRRALEIKVERAVDKFRPDDMEPLFPDRERVIEPAEESDET